MTCEPLGFSNRSDSLYLHTKCVCPVLLFNRSYIPTQLSNTSIVSIVLSHFILDLRACYNSALDPSSSSYGVSTLHFAAAVEGNIGASLDDSWIRGRPEDEEHQTQFSTHPLSVGLADKTSDEATGWVSLNFALADAKYPWSDPSQEIVFNCKNFLSGTKDRRNCLRGSHPTFAYYIAIHQLCQYRGWARVNIYSKESHCNLLWYKQPLLCRSHQQCVSKLEPGNDIKPGLTMGA